VDAPDRWNKPPLHYATLYSNTTAVATLLARADAFDADGVTALMLAAKNANMALVELLLRHGASVNLAETAHGRTAIMFAVKTGNQELVDRLAMSSSELLVSVFTYRKKMLAAYSCCLVDITAIDRSRDNCF